MADIVRLIVVDFNDMASDNSRILVHLERENTVLDITNFIRSHYPKYSQGTFRFGLLYGSEHKELTHSDTIGDILNYYKTDIPLFGFLHQAHVAKASGNLMSTGITTGDLYWAQVAAKHGDKVQRYVLSKYDADKFPGSIQKSLKDLQGYRDNMTLVGQKLDRKFPTSNNKIDNLILLNVPILYDQNDIIPVTYIIGTIKNSTNTDSFDMIKGRGGWSMQYKSMAGNSGTMYMYDVTGKVWHQMTNGEVLQILFPPKPSGKYVALADVDDNEVHHIIDRLYSR